jgi:hypothetical protein
MYVYQVQLECLLLGVRLIKGFNSRQTSSSLTRLHSTVDIGYKRQLQPGNTNTYNHSDGRSG